MKYLTFLSFIFFLCTGCIGDDIIQDMVDPELRIQNPIDSLTVGQAHQFEAKYLNNIGMEENVSIFWTSSDSEVLTISETGLASGLKAGQTTINAEAEGLQEAFEVIVTEEEVINPGGANNERSGTIRTTSSYVLEGEFVVKQDDSDLQIDIDETYRASAGLPGLYLYLTNNPNSINGAFEVGKVDIFNGAHSYTISGVDITTYSYLLYYCKPFGVKVGDGAFSD